MPLFPRRTSRRKATLAAQWRRQLLRRQQRKRSDEKKPRRGRSEVRTRIALSRNRRVKAVVEGLGEMETEACGMLGQPGEPLMVCSQAARTLLLLLLWLVN